MTEARPLLLCFDGSAHARRAISAAAELLGGRAAVVLAVWEAARDLTALDPLGDAVGRLSGIYAELDAAGLDAARPVLVVPPASDDQPGGTGSPSTTPRTA